MVGKDKGVAELSSIEKAKELINSFNTGINLTQNAVRLGVKSLIEKLST
jgi:hypothetical protein